MGILRWALAGLLMLAGASQTALADGQKIKLQLFGKDVIGDYDGCHFALWQHNRDPKKNRFAYVFYAPFNDGEELPGWMETSQGVMSLSRIAASPARTGERLERHLVYRSDDGAFTASIDILAQRPRGDDVEISKARVTLVTRKKLPFTVNAKGQLACPASAYEAAEVAAAPARTAPKRRPVRYRLEGDPIALGAPRELRSVRAIPRPMRRHIQRNFGQCNPGNGARIGARYAISNAMTLWEIHCALYNTSGSVIYATALNGNDEFFSFLTVPEPPSFGRAGDHEAFNPRINPRNGRMETFSLSGAGSCGTYALHQLIALPGEEVEFQLLEYREKQNCDGIVAEPGQFPLVYQAR